MLSRLSATQKMVLTVVVLCGLLFGQQRYNAYHSSYPTASVMNSSRTPKLANITYLEQPVAGKWLASIATAEKIWDQKKQGCPEGVKMKAFSQKGAPSIYAMATPGKCVIWVSKHYIQHPPADNLVCEIVGHEYGHLLKKEHANGTLMNPSLPAYDGPYQTLRVPACGDESKSWDRGRPAPHAYLDLDVMQARYVLIKHIPYHWVAGDCHQTKAASARCPVFNMLTAETRQARVYRKINADGSSRYVVRPSFTD